MISMIKIVYLKGWKESEKEKNEQGKNKFKPQYRNQSRSYQVNNYSRIGNDQNLLLIGKPS